MKAMSAAAAGLLLFAAVASAQYPRDENRSRPYTYNTTEQRQARVFDRLRTDLDRVDVSPQPFTADHARIMKARQEVDRLNQMIAEGNFDQADFDSTIASVQQVIDQNNLLSGDNRDYLMNDLAQLREYRDRAPLEQR